MKTEEELMNISRHKHYKKDIVRIANQWAKIGMKNILISNVINGYCVKAEATSQQLAKFCSIEIKYDIMNGK